MSRRVNPDFLTAHSGADDLFSVKSASGGDGGAKSVEQALRRSERDGAFTLQSNNLSTFPREIWDDGKDEDSGPKDFEGTSGPGIRRDWWEREVIVRIDLSFNNISEIPRELGLNEELCDKLRTVLLPNNALTRLDASFGNLRALVKLDLSHNQLTAIPELASSELQELLLSHNQLTGLSRNVWPLPLLSLLDVSSNQVSDIPDGVQFSETMGKLSLADNRLRQLPTSCLYGCNVLSDLDLSKNEIEVAPDLGVLANLARADFRFNRLQAAPTTAGANQGQLRELLLGQNSISSLEDSAELFLAPQLATLDLRENDLSTLPLEVGNAPSLKLLDLTNNNVSRVAPELGLCQTLLDGRVLVDGNPLRVMPSGFAQWETRKMIEFLRTRLNPGVLAARDANSAGGSGAQSEESPVSNGVASFVKQQLTELPDNLWYDASSVTSLDASNNRLQALGTDRQVKLLIRISRLKLVANQITSIQQLTRFTTLTEIDVTNNRLIEIPAGLLSLPQLRSFRAQNNQISSVDLAEDEDLGPALEEIFLADNKFTASSMPSPQVLARSTTLKVLDLSNNELTQIPPELGLCTSLTTLVLLGNPCRGIRQEVLRKPAAELLKYLRDRLG